MRLRGLGQQTLQVDGLGALDWQTESAIPDELCEWTETTGHTEGGGVVEGLLEAIVVEEDTGARVDVGDWVLGL